jgi:hypothetical protein
METLGQYLPRVLADIVQDYVSAFRRPFKDGICIICRKCHDRRLSNLCSKCAPQCALCRGPMAIYQEYCSDCAKKYRWLDKFGRRYTVADRLWDIYEIYDEIDMQGINAFIRECTASLELPHDVVEFNKNAVDAIGHARDLYNAKKNDATRVNLVMKIARYICFSHMPPSLYTGADLPMVIRTVMDIITEKLEI